MSPIRRAYPRVSDYKEPLIQVAVAFLTQVLHIDAASILDISFETTFASGFLSPYFPSSLGFREYAVTVRLSPPLGHLGDTLYLGIKYDADEYSVSEMAFKPGWKPVAKEQS